VDEREHHSHTAQTRLPLDTRIAGKGARRRRRRSRAGSGLTVTHGTPSRLTDGLGVSTITTAHATTMTEGARDATIATATVIATGRRTRGVRELSTRASRMRGSHHVSGLRPMYPGTMGTPTPVCDSRTTGSHATREKRQMTSSSSRTYRSTSVTPRERGSSTCPATRSTARLSCAESSSGTSKACHSPQQTMGVVQLQAATGRELT
jgi:hypothetical protein